MCTGKASHTLHVVFLFPDKLHIGLLTKQQKLATKNIGTFDGAPACTPLMSSCLKLV